MTERQQRMVEAFTAAMGRLPDGATVEKLVIELEREGVWNAEWEAEILGNAKKMDVRSLARSRDEDGRPRAESCPSPEGEIYKQESFFNADDYAYRAAYHERRRKHHQSERNYYLGQGRNRFGVEVRRAYKQLSLLPSLSSRIEVVPPEEAIATPW